LENKINPFSNEFILFSCFSYSGYCYPNTEEWEIVSQLPVHPEDIIIRKQANESFYKTNLTEVLAKYAIK